MGEGKCGQIYAEKELMEKLPYVMCNELLNAKNKSGVKK
jgi:hypothetical protein